MSEAEITLKEHFIALLEAQQRRVEEHFDMINRALEKSEWELNRRLSALNELRNEVLSDRGQFIQANACKIIHKDIDNWRETISEKITIIETRSLTWTTALVVFFVMVNIAMKFWK